MTEDKKKPDENVPVDMKEAIEKELSIVGLEASEEDKEAITALYNELDNIRVIGQVDQLEFKLNNLTLLFEKNPEILKQMHRTLSEVVGSMIKTQKVTNITELIILSKLLLRQAIISMTDNLREMSKNRKAVTTVQFKNIKGYQ